VPRKRLLACAFAVSLAVAACSGGSKKHAATSTSSAEFSKPTVALAVTGSELVSPHKALGPLDAPTADAVVKVIDRLLLVTAAQPLAQGRAGTGVGDLFTADAATRVTGADRAAFFDDGLPPFGELKTNLAQVKLTALAGSMDPATALVVADFSWDVASGVHAGDRVVHGGELSLVPVSGTWRIGAYTVIAQRTIDERTTTTTATTR
jgi:hypothetical protein